MQLMGQGAAGKPVPPVAQCPQAGKAPKWNSAAPQLISVFQALQLQAGPVELLKIPTVVLVRAGLPVAQPWPAATRAAPPFVECKAAPLIMVVLLLVPLTFAPPGWLRTETTAAAACSLPARQQGLATRRPL